MTSRERMQRERDVRQMLDAGMTNTGPLAARDATIQVLILPALIVAWGAAILVIAAVVT